MLPFVVMSSTVTATSHRMTDHDLHEVLAGTVSLALILVLQVAASGDELAVLEADRSLCPFIRMTRFQLERNIVEGIATLKGVSTGVGLFGIAGLAARRGTLWGLWTQKWSRLVSSNGMTHEVAMSMFQVSCLLQQIPWRSLSSLPRFAV